MTALTKYEMEDILISHEKSELEFDIDATMATLVPNPHYEITFMGLAIDGRDAIYRLYKRLLVAGAEYQNVQAVARIVAVAENSLVREAHVSFNTPEGKRVTGLYMVTMEFDPELKKIKGERMYADTLFAKAMADIIGADFANTPGVSRITDSAPIIEEHDAYAFAAARGVTIDNPANPRINKQTATTSSLA